jgi:hypothetical protein
MKHALRVPLRYVTLQRLGPIRSSAAVRDGSPPGQPLRPPCRRTLPLSLNSRCVRFWPMCKLYPHLETLGAAPANAGTRGVWCGGRRQPNRLVLRSPDVARPPNRNNQRPGRRLAAGAGGRERRCEAGAAALSATLPTTQSAQPSGPSTVSTNLHPRGALHAALRIAAGGRSAGTQPTKEEAVTAHSLRRSVLLLALAGAPALVAASGVMHEASAQGGGSRRTTSPVHWTWDSGAVLGESTLVRTRAGISASFRTTGLPPGQAITLWFIVFNNPAACASNPCGGADFTNPAVQADALWATGHNVGGSGRGGFGAHLRVGDASGSALIEMGQPDAAVGLLDPMNAEVHLLLHSHGPALSGQALKAQLTSFLGGCEVFLGGADGIADGPADIPVNVGECSTFQASVHQ